MDGGTGHDSGPGPACRDERRRGDPAQAGRVRPHRTGSARRSRCRIGRSDRVHRGGAPRFLRDEKRHGVQDAMNENPILRVASEADAAEIRDIYAPHVEHAAVSFETAVPAEAEMAARIGRLLPTHPWLVAAVGGRVAGYAYAGPHRERAAYRWSVEVTAY